MTSPDAKPAGKDMRLRILACRHVYRGKNARGDEYNIYEVDAAKLDGTPVNEKLRSFAPLPIGQDVDVTVTPFVSERHGRSFTLQQKGSRHASTQAQINELRETVEQQRVLCDTLRKRIELLELRVGGGEETVAVSASTERNEGEQW